jgi:hypothetical protein
MSKVPQFVPSVYAIADFPVSQTPDAGTVAKHRTPSGWAEKRSDGSTYQFCLSVESAKAPTVADLDTPWSIWWHYDYDMANAKATVWRYERSPVSNDVFKSHASWEIAVILTPVLKSPGVFDLALPQGATFGYTVSRLGQLNQASFPAGVFSSIVLNYLDVAKVAIANAGQTTISPTLTAAGLGTVDAPANARFLRVIFTYIIGGSLSYDIAI